MSGTKRKLKLVDEDNEEVNYVVQPSSSSSYSYSGSADDSKQGSDEDDSEFIRRSWKWKNIAVGDPDDIDYMLEQ